MSLFINSSFHWALDNKILNTNELELLNENEVITLVVLFLNRIYIENCTVGFNKTSISNLKKSILIFHEDLHDSPEHTINHFFSYLGFDILRENDSINLFKETNSVSFGRESVEHSLNKLSLIIDNFSERCCVTVSL